MALANTQKNQKKMCKPKPAVHSTSVSTVHMCVLIRVYNNCGIQYSTDATEQFW